MAGAAAAIAGSEADAVDASARLLRNPGPALVGGQQSYAGIASHRFRWLRFDFHAIFPVHPEVACANWTMASLLHSKQRVEPKRRPATPSMLHSSSSSLARKSEVCRVMMGGRDFSRTCRPTQGSLRRQAAPTPEAAIVCHRAGQKWKSTFRKTLYASRQVQKRPYHGVQGVTEQKLQLRM